MFRTIAATAALLVAASSATAPPLNPAPLPPHSTPALGRCWVFEADQVVGRFIVRTLVCEAGDSEALVLLRVGEAIEINHQR